MAPRLLHVWVLWAFALAQPLYHVVRRNGEFFVAHEADRVDLILLTLTLSLLLPALAAAVVWLAGRISPRAGSAAMLVVVALFAGLIALQAFRAAGGLDTTVSFAAAALIGAGAAWAYARFAGIRQVLTVSSPAVLLFPILFLASGSIRALMAPLPLPADAAAPGATSTPVVVVVFDQLPLVSLMDGHGNIDAAAFPSFAALAADATWFRNATTVADLTGWALPALVSGEFPVRDTLPVTADHPRNLFTMLASTHQMEVVEPITKLCPEALCASERDPRIVRQLSMLSDLSIVYPRIFLPPDLAETLPPLTNNWRDFAQNSRDWRRRWVTERDRDRRLSPQRFIDGIDRDDPPATLYFLHTLLPHEPYLYLEDGTQITEESTLAGLVEGRWIRDEWTVAQAYRRHLLQVQYADTILGQLIARLKSEGLYERAIVVVTSDHGASFRPDLPFKAVLRTTLPGIAAVPLIVKAPESAAGTISDRNVQSIDVLPTIADLLEIEVPRTPAGASAFSDSPAPPEKTVRHDDAANVTRAGPSMLPRVSDFVAYKVSLFGPSASGRLWRQTKAPSPELIGKPVTELAVGSRSALNVRLVEPWRYELVDPASGFVPALIRGEVRGDAGAATRWPLAVAVNGVIRETTWSAGSATSRPGLWTAIVAPAAFVAGRNAIEMFEITIEAGTVVLRTALKSSERPARLNLTGADGIDWGVEAEGLYGLEGSAPTFRWSDGDARLTIDVDPRTPPRFLRVATASPAHRAQTTIRVNGCTVFEGVLPVGATDRTFPLETCGRDLFEDGRARIEIRSDSFTPPGGDTRRLGLPLAVVEMGTDPVY